MKARLAKIKGAQAPAPAPKRPRLSEVLNSRISTQSSSSPGPLPLLSSSSHIDENASQSEADLISTLIRLLRKNLKTRSASDSDSGSESGEEAGGHSGRARQLNLMHTHQKHPGRLAERVLKLMDLHVGDRVAPGTKLGPIVLVYVNTIMFAILGRDKMGLRNSREALTLATAMDALLRGNAGGAMDVLAQRLKALERSIVDSNWQVARWMELIPTRGRFTFLSGGNPTGTKVGEGRSGYSCPAEGMSTYSCRCQAPSKEGHFQVFTSRHSYCGPGRSNHGISRSPLWGWGYGEAWFSEIYPQGDPEATLMESPNLDWLVFCLAGRTPICDCQLPVCPTRFSEVLSSRYSGPSLLFGVELRQFLCDRLVGNFIYG